MLGGMLGDKPALERHRGKRVFNGGDFAMLNYTLDNNEYPSASFLVVADDTEREYGNPEKAAEMNSTAADSGWTAISMRDDWATIYGDGVEKTHLGAASEQ